MLGATLVVRNSKITKEPVKYNEKKDKSASLAKEQSEEKENYGQLNAKYEELPKSNPKCFGDKQQGATSPVENIKIVVHEDTKGLLNEKVTNHDKEKDKSLIKSSKEKERQYKSDQHISFSVRTVSNLVASLPACVFLSCKTKSEVSDLELTNVEITVTNEELEIDSVVTPVRPSVWKVTFRPSLVGKCTLDIIFNQYNTKKELQVSSNRPVDELSFYKECPTDIYVTRSNFVYVSYMNTVVKYSSGGVFLREVVQDLTIFINYLAVSEKDGRIVTSGTKWTEESDDVYRSNNINVYSRMGVLLSSFQSESPFSLAISIDINDHICGLSTKYLDFYDFDGNMLKDIELGLSVGPCSKFSLDKENKLYVADSLSNNVIIFNDDGKLVSRFFGLQDSSNNLGALSDVSVDDGGQILVSERFANQVVVYSSTGETMAVIGSETSPLKWPSAVAVSGDGHVYIADHGHVTVKKYKYK